MNRTKRLLLSVIVCVCSTSIAICCVGCNKPAADSQHSSVQRITERGKLLVGTTGDYRPLSYREADSTYWGFDI